MPQPVLRTDITSLKQTEAALVNREARLRAIMDTVLDGIVVIDGCGVISAFNRAAEAIFGYSAGEVIGKKRAKIKMAFPGLKKDQDIADLIAFLTASGGA